MDRFNIGFIGAGKVAVTLGSYFVSKGVCVNGYYSKTKSSAEKAGILTCSKAFSDISDLLNDCNFIFITTPDCEIQKVWGKINKYNICEKIIIHTSGTQTCAIFNGIENLNAYGYSLHPMYAFSKKDGSFKNLDKACFTLEGNDKKILQVKEFVKKMGNTVFLIDGEEKPLYHLTNVMASNFVLALIYESLAYLENCGITGDKALGALMPLIKANICNIENSGAVYALTGPVERNDVITIEKHLEVIPKEDKNLYKDLSLILTDIAQRKNPKRDYQPLTDILKSDI